MKKYYFVPAMLFLSTIANAYTISPPEIGPAPFNSGSWARRTIQDLDQYSTLSSENQNETVIGPNGSVSYKTNISTGSIGVSAAIEDTNNGYSWATMEAAIFDTLVFNFNGEESQDVKFSLNISGKLSNSGSNAFLVGGGYVSVADVTGLETSFFVSGSTQNTAGALLTQNGPEIIYDGENHYDVESDKLISKKGGLAIVDQSKVSDIFYGNFRIGVADSYIVSTDGSINEFSRQLSGDFEAIAGHSYAIFIDSSAHVSGDGPSLVNLLGTTTFAFTDLSGGTFVSDSGFFPGSSPTSAPVPEPATMLLFGTGIAGLAAVGRRKRS